MKILWIVLGCVLMLVLAVLSLRIRVQLKYDRRGLRVQVRAVLFRFSLVPSAKKSPQKSKKQTEERPDKAVSQNETLPKGGSVAKVRSFLPMGMDAIGALGKRIQVDYLRVHYTIAGQPDPAMAALQYGGVCVGGGALCILLEQHMKVKERAVSAEVDFSSETSVIFVAASCSLRIGQGLAVLFRLTKCYLVWKKQQK